MIALQQPDRPEIIIAKQTRAPHQGREGWCAITADKDLWLKLFQQVAEDLPEIVRTAFSDISSDKIIAWPFFVVPELDM